MKKMILMWLLLAAGIAMLCSGCTALNETAQRVSDNLSDKALTADAFVHVLKVTPSDPASNSVPTVKEDLIIGKVKSIPLVGKEGETVKDYAEYKKIKTAAWYNSDNVTEEESFIGTGDNAKEVAAWFKAKQAKEDAKAASTEAAK